jgi:PilZ domain
MNLPDPGFNTPAVAAPERRRYPRHTVNVPIEIHEDGNDVPLRFETTDLSRGGCYIQLMIPLSVGIRLRATLWLDGSPVSLRGLVVTRHPQFGNGIMFVEFAADGEKILQRYLNAITT